MNRHYCPGCSVTRYGKAPEPHELPFLTFKCRLCHHDNGQRERQNCSKSRVCKSCGRCEICESAHTIQIPPVRDPFALPVALWKSS